MMTRMNRHFPIDYRTILANYRRPLLISCKAAQRVHARILHFSTFRL